MAKITPEYVENANERQIRSLMSRTEYIVVNSYDNLLSVEELEHRVTYGHNSRLTNNRHVGEFMEEGNIRMAMAITDMAAKQSNDSELAGDLEPDLSWLQIPSDEDKYIIVLTIRKFLAHQEIVHGSLMSKPSKIELRDYDVLKRIHNYLLEDATDWINRVSPIRVNKKSLEDGDLSTILNGGGSIGIMHEDNDKPKGPKTLLPLDVDQKAFAGLNGLGGGW